MNEAASAFTVTGEQVNERIFSRPGGALEIAPGLIATQHSGDGKANQWFSRGFNLDHGTELAIFLDGMPMNMPTHAHGQGYADVNMLIPELISSVDIEKGPCFADVGDFASAGSNSRSDQITYAYGSFLKTDPLFKVCNAPSSTFPVAVCQNGSWTASSSRSNHCSYG